MDFMTQLESGRYGSFELKRHVGPNLIKGLIISVFIHSVVIASPFVVKLFRGGEEVVITTEKPLPPSEIVPFRPLLKPQRWITLKNEPVGKPVATRPVAVEDEPVNIEQPKVLTQEQLKSVIGDTSDLPISKSAGTGGGDLVINEPIPSPDIFIPTEVDPRALEGNPYPAYPDYAKTAKVAGKVWVKVYIDQSGQVRKWIFLKTEPKGLGFEEEVAKVIEKWRFTPAIQQKTPVGVWLSIPFTFKFQNQ